MSLDPVYQADGPESLAQGVVQGSGGEQRRAMAKAITLVESSLARDAARADALLANLLPHTGGSYRIGISGVPGVGKSTLIEALGLFLIERGHRVAVLSVDPSSARSGGSILGDKTRMERLSVHQMAFIRPSPTGGHLGGVTGRTREAILVCEAAGYDIVIVETVGVGQSEIAVAGMTDLFVLMQLPNAGDELQAIKRGVMEFADLVLVNKADLDPDAATRAQAQLTSTMRVLAQQHGAKSKSALEDWLPAVLQVSALRAEGIEAFWAAVERFQSRPGGKEQRRSNQARQWLMERVEEGLKQWFWSRQGMQADFAAMLQQVQSGVLPAPTGARRLLVRVGAGGEGTAR